MLDLEQDREEWAAELEKQRKKALGLEVPAETKHH
jgi:hypothetical protein